MKSFTEHLTENMNKQKALEFIKTAHAGQKYGSSPYWTHPKAVADVGKKGVWFKNLIRRLIWLRFFMMLLKIHRIKKQNSKKLGFDDEILDAVKAFD